MAEGQFACYDIVDNTIAEASAVGDKGEDDQLNDPGVEIDEGEPNDHAQHQPSGTRKVLLHCSA